MNKQTQTLINTYVVAAISFDVALAAIAKAYAGDKLSPADLRLGLALAYVHHKPAAYASQFDKDTGTCERSGSLRKQVNREAAKIMGATATGSSEDTGAVRISAEQKVAYATYTAAIARAEKAFATVCGKDSAKVKKAMKARG